ncbi:hypothetical protein [Shewanella algae]|uniref:hypothetical protein n=1 Tax=Shewanella algae TaxID=38313 RepID=UPI0015A6F6CF
MNKHMVYSTQDYVEVTKGESQGRRFVVRTVINGPSGQMLRDKRGELYRAKDVRLIHSL